MCSCGYPYRCDTVIVECYCGTGNLENLERAVRRKGPALKCPSTVSPGLILPAGMAQRLGIYETHYRQTRPRDRLTLILLNWKIRWATNNASRWQKGFNSAFKGLNNTWLGSGLRKTPTWSKTSPHDVRRLTPIPLPALLHSGTNVESHWRLEANLVPHKGSWPVRSIFINSPLLHVWGTDYGHLQGATNFIDLHSTSASSHM